MQAFFGGTVILLYFISNYVAEAVFIAACLLPALYFLAVGILLRFGGCGKMIAAKSRLKRLVKKGVISGERRALLYRKCVKGMPPSVRAAYALFTEGKTSAEEFTLTATGSVKVRGELLKGGMWGVGVACSLSAFLAFYFAAPIEEALLRTAICAFFASINGVALHFALYACLAFAEKAAERFVRLLDEKLLRERREDPALKTSAPVPAPTITPIPVPSSLPKEEPKDPDEDAVFDLRRLLRDLDAAGKGE